MITLGKALTAWGTPAFNDVLKDEIEQLNAEQLPLQEGLTQCNSVSDSGFNAMIISVSEAPGVIQAKTGIFYAGIISGCSCADDPTPVDEYTEYCVVQFAIDKNTAAATVTLLTE